MKVSVCICTYNRASSLKKTLKTVAAQHHLESENFEVIVIDNNSTDDTQDIIRTFSHTLPIRCVREAKQGLSHARNRAVSEASGELIIFTDDDVRLDEDWVTAYRTAVRDFPQADYFGGRILPDWQGRKPKWVGDKPLPLLDGILVWFDLGVDTRPYGPADQGPVGASFAITRRLLDKLGGFRTDLGRSGTDVGRGEETEFILRARSGRATGVYVGAALCWHAFDPHRLSLPALYRYGVASGRAHRAITGTSDGGSLASALGCVARGVLQLLRGHHDRFRQCIVNAGIQMSMRASRRSAGIRPI